MKKPTEIKNEINNMIQEMITYIYTQVNNNSIDQIEKELKSKYKTKILDIYNAGAKDAWNIAKQIESMTVGEVSRLFEISPRNGDKWVCNSLSFEEVKKILDSVINIDDEVIYITESSVSNGYGVVTSIFDTNNEHMACVLWKNGTSGCYKTSELKRTGKTISVKELLSQITG